MQRRVQHRMMLTRSPDLAAYEALVRTDPRERAELLSALLIKTTQMFRDATTFATLRDAALPELFRARAAEGATALRAWVVGCASGEEAFSIAMCLLDAASAHPSIEPSVLASDIDPGALARVASGLVAPSAASHVPPELASRWMTREESAYRIADSVRAIVTAAYHDVLDNDAPAPRNAVFASFDIVSCRNLLIYLERPAQERVLHRLIRSCAPGGLLVLGEAELAHDADAFERLRAIRPGVPAYRVT